jgi:hypothetical protein
LKENAKYKERLDILERMLAGTEKEIDPNRKYIGKTFTDPWRRTQELNPDIPRGSSKAPFLTSVRHNFQRFTLMSTGITPKLH